ncbi:MAG: response regulator [Candidatus Acidiferrum sp.]|jgi:CheY-like chemotaxis protein
MPKGAGVWISACYRNRPMNKHRILLVDDNEDILAGFQEGLEGRGFEVVPAATVNEALRLIASEHFDVLVSQLHTPHAGEGLTVVSAMRQAHPGAVTLTQDDCSVMQEALSAICLKPIDWAQIAEIIQKKLSSPKAGRAIDNERVAAILERETAAIIQDWLSHVERSVELTAVPLRRPQRTGHLPLLLADIIDRLRLHSIAKAHISRNACAHGALRCIQGYSLPMMVEESRMLHLSIFSTLQNNLGSVDFGTVLLDVMAITDEVDSQLKQAVLGFMTPQPAMTAGVSGRPG